MITDPQAAVAAATWLLALALAGITIYIAIAIRRLTKPIDTAPATNQIRYSRSRAGANTKLGVALAEATAVNPFRVHAHGDTRIGMHTTLRLAPAEFRAAVEEISQHVLNGRTVSVDVGNLDVEHAVRLVNYCGGMATAVSGWIFQASDEVFVLTPSTTKLEPF